MSAWKWLSTPSEPKGTYALLTGLGTFVLMIVSSPLWADHGFFGALVAGGTSGFLGGVLAKLWMERRK
ncbi:hypothetical protein ACG74X_05770 [Marivita sp. S0852]|uniref:hypothetical protein n=1 Tax=Marivita sp. S0852 TaxID=3373893 RepID=UPI0039829AE7